jgi:hypothetical protein
MYIRIADILTVLWKPRYGRISKEPERKIAEKKIRNNKVFPLINNHGLFCDFKTILFIDPVGLQKNSSSDFVK